MGKIGTYIALIVGISGLIVAFFALNKAPKIGFIRSAKVVEEYKGYQEAQAEYQSRLSKWTAELDTLKARYQKVLIDYQSNASTMKDAERKTTEQILMKQQQDIQRYAQETEKRSQEEYERIMQGALNQVNAFVEEYSVKHGYDMIFGVTLSGNIMYGADAIDLTEPITTGLNDAY